MPSASPSISSLTGAMHAVTGVRPEPEAVQRFLRGSGLLDTLSRTRALLEQATAWGGLPDGGQAVAACILEELHALEVPDPDDYSENLEHSSPSGGNLDYPPGALVRVTEGSFKGERGTVLAEHPNGDTTEPGWLWLRLDRDPVPLQFAPHEIDATGEEPNLEDDQTCTVVLSKREIAALLSFTKRRVAPSIPLESAERLLEGAIRG